MNSSWVGVRWEEKDVEGKVGEGTTTYSECAKVRQERVDSKILLVLPDPIRPHLYLPHRWVNSKSTLDVLYPFDGALLTPFS